jgi:GTP-binding protein
VTERRLDPLQIVDASYIGGAGVSVSAGREAAAAGHLQLPPPTIAEVAFAGRSNVGKSSLINTLVDRRGLVRTSSTPGSTRQINLFEARARDGTLFRLVDLPGYGFTRRSKAEQGLWAALIEGYLRERVTLAAVVLLVDARRGLLAEDVELIRFIEAARGAARRPVQVILAATKVDKLARSARKSTLDRLARAIAERRSADRPRGGAAGAAGAAADKAPRSGAIQRLVGFSAVTGEGTRELWLAIRRAALGGAPETGGAGEGRNDDPDA